MTTLNFGKFSGLSWSHNHVLCAGLVCVDVIQVVKSFPVEDSDERSLKCYLQRGGNASNNCSVLSHLRSSQYPVSFIGTSASTSVFWDFLKKDFTEHNIHIDDIVLYSKYSVPLSTVIVNDQNGTRTIVHSNKDLPELKYSDFLNVDLSKYSWIHFEGRQPHEMAQMMRRIHEHNNGLEVPIVISVELEKPLKNLLDLAALADVVFIGKDFALMNQWNSMEDAVLKIQPFLAKRSGTSVCSWGDKGAAGCEFKSEVIVQPSYATQVKDSLGAGDTFHAACIHALSTGSDLRSALKYGCEVASVKLTDYGYTHLKNYNACSF